MTAYGRGFASLSLDGYDFVDRWLPDDRGLLGCDNYRILLEVFCDLRCFTTVCFVDGDTMSNLSESKTQNLKSKKVFYVDRNGYVHVDQSAKEFQTCSSIVQYDGQRNLDRSKIVVHLQTFEWIYTQGFTVTYSAGDVDSPEAYFPASVQGVQLFIGVIPESTVYFSDSGIVISYQTILKIRFILQTTCSKHWYGFTCWYHCEDDYRKYCVCSVQMEMPCQVFCRAGWIPQILPVMIGKEKLYISTCQMVDLCRKKICPYQHQCLQIDNETVFCEFIEIIIRREGIGDNLTSATLFVNEPYELFINYSKLKHPKLVEYIYLETRIELPSTILTKIQYVRRTIITFSQLAPIDVSIPAYIIIYYSVWSFYDERIHYFKINEKPIFVKVLRQDLSELGRILLIGELIRSYSNGRPDHLMRVTFELTSYTKYKVKFYGNKIMIPNTFPIGLTAVYCQVVLVVEYSGNYSTDHLTSVTIKPFENFQWSSFDDSFYFGKVLSCEVHCYVKHSIYVYQELGFSYINTVDHKHISTKDATGGLYKLNCVLYSKFFGLYMRMKYFMIRVNPTFICFHIHTMSPGSMVQCAHDGFPEDEFKIRLIIYFLSDDEWKFVSAESEYGKLPYKYYESLIKVVCRVTSRFNQSISSLMIIKFNIIDKTWFSYFVSPNHRLCELLGNRMEPLIVRRIYDNVYDIAHDIFVLDYELVDLSLSFVLMICSFGFDILMILWCILVRFEFHNSRENLLQVNRYVYKKKRNILIYRVNQKADRNSKSLLDNNEIYKIINLERTKIQENFTSMNLVTELENI